HAPSPSLIFTLSLHDALPISNDHCSLFVLDCSGNAACGLALGERGCTDTWQKRKYQYRHCFPGSHDLYLMRTRKAVSELVLSLRSEEHTSELQSRFDLVCRLL